MMSMNLSDILILNSKGSGYHCIISLISKKRGHKPNASCQLNQKSGTL